MRPCENSLTVEEEVKIAMNPPELNEMKQIYPHLKPGGHNIPQMCRPSQKTLIIVPYR